MSELYLVLEVMQKNPAGKGDRGTGVLLERVARAGLSSEVTFE